MKYELIHGDCLDVLRKMEDNSVDAIVTDAPYGLSFMGKKWDYDVPSVEIWMEALRVLKHGGHLLCFGGSRTYHRMAVNIEDAGFEIRDQIMWVYGSGFPKSLNISKAIDKAAGAEREVIGQNKNARGTRSDKYNTGRGFGVNPHLTASKTPKAQQWEGWGSTLKPAHEPIVVARKPLIGTIVENVLKYGTGGLNIDASRVGDLVQDTSNNGRDPEVHKKTVFQSGLKKDFKGEITVGRFPANFIHDGSDEVVSLFPESRTNRIEKPCEPEITTEGWGTIQGNRGARGYDDEGSAARFFYCAKASKGERNAGLENLDDVERTNTHPTVKPIALMEYLCRLITQPNGIVLDLFMGSGTTGIGALKEGFSFIGIEREEEYIKIARQRIEHWFSKIEEEVQIERAQKSLF